MRTTVTLDPDVEHFLREACHQRNVSFKRALNDAVRQSLKPPESSLPELRPPRSMGLAPGIDPRKLSEVADDLEVEAFLAAESARDHYGEEPRR